jgi:hypothetical protein
VTVSTRSRLRRIWFALLTTLGIARRGYFIPCRHAAPRPRAQDRSRDPALEARFALHSKQFCAALDWLDAFAEDFSRIGDEPPPAPRWTQTWFPRLDAAVTYTFVRLLAPRRIVEIGSGHSTRFLARAVTDGGLQTQLIAIDPNPRASLGALPVQLIRAAFQEAKESLYRDLAPGDFLMIDSSHILMPGSDVDHFFSVVLPDLPAGVLVHFHDIFLPDDYPVNWHWRGYNEQLGVLPLLFGGAWRVLFASHYATTRMSGVVASSAAARLPLPADARESGLWLRKCDQ